jgi:hypothetical protein
MTLEWSSFTSLLISEGIQVSNQFSLSILHFIILRFPNTSDLLRGYYPFDPDTKALPAMSR